MPKNKYFVSFFCVKRHRKTMKIILLPLKSYLNVNINRTYFAFIKELKINPIALFYQWLELPWYFGEVLDLIRGISLPALFDKFDKGLITPTQFRTELRNKFSALANKTDADIDKAWSKMYIVDPKACQAFNEAKKIHNNETLFVTFYGDMNILHAQTIKEQYNQVTEQINLIPGKLLLSYLEGVTGLELVAKYTQKEPLPILEQDQRKEKSKKPKILIAESPRDFPAKILAIYTPPPGAPYPKLGWIFSWIFAPWQSWIAYNKQVDHHNLVNLAKQNDFTLIPCQSTANAANLIQSVQAFVDINTKSTPRVTTLDFSNLQPSIGYTPRHSAGHYSPIPTIGNTARLSPPRSPSTPTGQTRFKNFKISS